MTTNRPEFKAHDDFIFGHKKIGKVTREVFIKYIRSTHDQIRKLIQIIQQYSQTIESFEENEQGRESAESERVANEEERLEQTEQLLQATTMAFTEFIFSQTMGNQHDDN